MNNTLAGASTDAVEDFSMAGTGICFVVMGRQRRRHGRGRNPRDLRTVLQAAKAARSVARSHRADTDVHPRYGVLVGGQPGAQAHSFWESAFGKLKSYLATPPWSEGAGDGGSVGHASAGIGR